VLSIALFGFYCTSAEKTTENATTYLNLHDSVRYVGKQVCLSCHAGAHNSYLETGMGHSFGLATKLKSAGRFEGKTTIYDATLDLYYQPYFSEDTLCIKEFRLSGKDTIHKRIQAIQYIIGSGHHTNSHLFASNGYVFQAPLTYYTQKGIWDLPPGFENGFNSRFTRQIGLECMACHNAQPAFAEGSENKFLKIPEGIDCERCHGPGSIHVREKQAGNFIDTSKYIDYSIVNPGKLSVDLQFDVCQRCHLQGNAVLKEGKSFLDFKPGMKLSDVIDVYLPRYEGDESEFIMASHADRLKQSACFKVMADKHGDSKSLRPYKNAMTCVTCHNPHVSVRKQGDEPFNSKCSSCHAAQKVSACSETPSKIDAAGNNCVSCHMPVSGSIDIPHVTVHDHYIRPNPKMNPSKSVQKTAESFRGLQCINNTSPDERSRIIAYIQQFEKFDPGKSYLLDSAEALLKRRGETQFKSDIRLSLAHAFAGKDYAKVSSLATQYGRAELLSLLSKKSKNNEDAWAAYRVAESFTAQGLPADALPFFEKACTLAPLHFEFRNKYGACLMQLGKIKEAEKEFAALCREAPFYAPAFCNYGYCLLMHGDGQSAKTMYTKALQLDPDYKQALINLVGLELYNGRTSEAQKYMLRLEKAYPNDEEIKALKNRISEI
ncbi:MAG: tetratricopeptide repeat protein, partial [Bacteroidia bacterium]